MDNNEMKHAKENQREKIIEILIQTIKQMEDEKLQNLYHFILHIK